MDRSEAPAKKSHPFIGMLLGSLGAAVLAVLGIILLGLGNKPAAYGWTMFIILPMAAGMLIACISRSVAATLASVLLAIVVCLVFLVLGGLEGVVCILMAFPLFFAFALVGALIGVAISWLARNNSGPRSSPVLLPLIGVSSIFGAEQAENRLVTGNFTETVTTTRTVLGTPDQVWAKILVIDKVSGSKPLLLRIGLPVPRSCTLEGRGVGARRVCRFDIGVIDEEVTSWEPGRRLGLRIIRSTLPGRHWLRFESAFYELERVSATQTRLTRTTTISTWLRPRWYWRNFEAMGIQAEHGYLFDSVF